MILFILAAPEGASVFLTSATDNIVHENDLRRLAFDWEDHKLDEICKLVWAHAQDLVLWCLQTDPSRRPSSFKDVLDHPFLGGNGALRFLGDAHSKALEVFKEADVDGNGTLDKDEVMSLTNHIAGSVDSAAAELLMEEAVNPSGRKGMSEQSIVGYDVFFEWFLKLTGETLEYTTEQRAIELHTATQDGNMAQTKTLFASGGVHYNLPRRADGEHSHCSVLPLHRAAHHGNLNIVKFLLNEIHPYTRPAVLDAQTKLGYTAHMLACESGHTEIAQLLEAAGPDVELRNSAGKTGHELAIIATQQEEQAKLTPFRHGHGLALGCESLESYLGLREKMLDEDVAAGIRLWHTKQAVFHFDKEAMEQLEATVKDLQAKSFDVAVSSRQLASISSLPPRRLTCAVRSFTSPTSEVAAWCSTARASAHLLSANSAGKLRSQLPCSATTTAPL
eukprot:COSAG04_NODE_1562_length_6335_cov_34.922226_3_plen_448_part_00